MREKERETLSHCLIPLLEIPPSSQFSPRTRMRLHARTYARRYRSGHFSSPENEASFGERKDDRLEINAHPFSGRKERDIKYEVMCRLPHHSNNNTTSSRLKRSR